MKKITTLFYVFAVLALFVLMTGCGNDGNDPIYNMCNAGEYRCMDTDILSPWSEYCLMPEGRWDFYQSCEGECDLSTGRCKCHDLDGKMWSSYQNLKMTWDEAVDYCDNLTECGYSDWHLPTIDELKMLVLNCDSIAPSGECGVTDDCLSKNDCWTSKSCTPSCPVHSSWQHSKLGDVNALWSSSTLSDESGSAWAIYFQYAMVVPFNKYYIDYDGCDVRCVR